VASKFTQFYTIDMELRLQSTTLQHDARRRKGEFFATEWDPSYDEKFPNPQSQIRNPQPPPS